MQKENLNIMLTCVNSQVSPSVIQLIYGHPNYGINVIGIDAVPLRDNLGKDFCKRCYQVPRGIDEDYFPSIKRIVEENDIKLIFPGSDEESISLAKHREELKQVGCDVACSSYDVISEVSDKYRLIMKLKSAGIYTSEVFSPETVSDLKVMAEEMGYPDKDIVIKPRFGRGSKGFKIITRGYDKYDSFYNGECYRISLEEIIDIFKEQSEEISKYLLMEYYPGNKYSADVLVSDGKVHSMVIRNNGTLPKTNPPTQVADIVFDEDIRNYAESIIGELGFNFFVQIEVGRKANGSPGLIEANTRLDATLPITTGLGLNFYHEMIIYALKGKMREDIKDYRDYEKKIIFKRYWQHLFEETIF
jgi:biotin carboxylase